MAQAKKLIGRAERISFPTLGIKRVPAKVDTGADASSIWCSKIKLVDNHLKCVFFGEESPFYNGETVRFKSSDVDLTRVYNSFGQSELRYKVKIPVEVKGQVIIASFTLADRSTKIYPVLIGRSTLKGRFIVDVTKGSPMLKEERESMARIREEMAKVKKELKI